MKFYDILNISPEDCKVHLAQWNGAQEPLDLYFSGEFQHWQERQSKRYFERKFILSLIRYQRDNLWLFVGVYESKGVKETDREGRHYYNTELSQIGESLRGRLIINYKRQGRIAYPNGESLDNVATVYKITPEPIAIADFPGFKDVLLSRKQLNIIFSEMYPSWKSALSSVSGVYLISDTRTGKLYVGSASGGEGIWQRWCNAPLDFG
ncbi:GIY-YIG nuclease family protein [Pseudoalteromonas rubra]|uniref:GIY-YIG nuclease family protein n=1 Tax=Pseudoalteromonas rubra TaxID=43658 RepID=UPI002DBB4A7D|nr:GIY-YIG nuclease family protein [Pseudoalteromonas rubra]MEC4091887.1 GIY-YIG nuclease family protein [Pseudoalteromonas rubra]